MTLQEFLQACRERLEAAKYNDWRWAIADSAPTEAINMQIAIRTAAFPLIQNAPTDIAKLLACVEYLMPKLTEDDINKIGDIISESK